METAQKRRTLYGGKNGEGDERLARTLLIIIVTYWAGSGLIMFMDVIWGDRSLWLLLLSGCILQLIPLYLLLQKKLAESSLTTVGIYIFFITFSAAIGQGIHDYALTVYPVMIMFAGLTQKRRGMIFATTLTLVGIAWLVFADIYGLYTPRTDQSATLFDYVILAVIVIISNLAVHLVMENLDSANNRLKTELVERKRSEEALQASEERIRQWVDSAPDAILVVDGEGTINFANAEATNLLGYSNAEFVGKNVDELTPARFRSSHAIHRLAYSDKPYVRQFGSEISLIALHKSGAEIPVDIKLSHYRSGEGLNIIAFMQDITERRNAESQLRESEARFRLLFENMLQGVVFQSPGGEITLANSAAERLLGLTLDQMQGRTSMDPRWKTIHEDGSDFPGQEHPAILAFRTGREVHNVIMGVFNPQAGKHRWISINAVPQFKEGEATPYRVFTTFEDVTDRKSTDEALKASEMRYRLLAENISDVIWILDTNEMRFRYVSPSVERLRGYTVDEMLQQNISEVLTPASLQLFQEKYTAYMQEFLDGNTGFHIDEVEQPCKDGSTVWTESTTNFRVNQGNSHLEVYGVSRDITERKLNERLLMQANQQLQSHIKRIEQLSEKLQEQAIRDPLTGLHNRRYLDESLERELSRSKRENIPVSLLMIDIDHFKIVNDSHGHQVGDAFLEKIAELLKSNSRTSDIVCRFGGEEFILVMPGADEIAAWNHAEKIRQKCAAIRIPLADEHLSITISIGAAIFPIHAKKAEDLIVKADKAMYESKRAGRNRVTVFQSFVNDPV